MRLTLLFLFACATQVVLFAACAKDADRVTSLPGLTAKINFTQYAGYISVNEKQTRNMFYWFVESQGNPSSDPLFLWLQGGPGCSSLLGFFTEIGPFSMGPNNTLTLNPNSWNKNVNYLFLESPVGVGFSYDSDNDYKTGDNRTFEDAYRFLQNWFKAFPEYSKHDFYITGESYAGHYVPQLAYAILQNNKNKSNAFINLKGILVGNAWTDDVIDSNSLPYFIFYHHLASLETWREVQAACNFTSSKYTPFVDKTPFHDFKLRRLQSVEDNCDSAIDKMFDEVGENTNQYDIYAPCVEGVGLDCIDYSPQVNYLNSANVQAAIHAKKPANPWDICVDLDYEQSWRTVLNIYPTLMSSLHVTVFAGDVTYNVPALGTEVWVADLGHPIVRPWTHWDINGQVAGYYIKYREITFVTVKNSGHMVPFYTPESAYYMLQQYLKGQF